MKKYRVRYYLDDMLHTYLIEADCEYDAIKKAVKNMEYSADIMHDFEIDQWEPEW